MEPPHKLTAALDRLTVSAGTIFKESQKKDKGLSAFLTAVFILAEMAGCGMMALSKAISESGWWGMAVLFYYGVNACLAGILLGKSWLIIEDRHPEYRRKVGNPYPVIGAMALGNWTKIPVSILSYITLLGTNVVYLLLISKFLQLMLPFFNISFCVWILILSAVLLPCVFKRAPQDFWYMAVLALVTTLVSYTLGLKVMFSEYNDIAYKNPPRDPVNFAGFFLGVSTFAFSFGGVSTYPTFQNDMKNRHKFPLAVITAYVVLVAMYLSMGASGYLVYGSTVQSNVLESLRPGPDSLVAQIFLILHLAFAFYIMMNTPCQEIEEYLNIPTEFGWKRFVLRTSIMLLLVLIAESIPEFGKILNLVGALSSSATTFVFPALFYIALCQKKPPPGCPDTRLSIWTILYLGHLIIVGLVNGGIGTWAALGAILSPDAFSTPCYLMLFKNTTAATTFSMSH